MLDFVWDHREKVDWVYLDDKLVGKLHLVGRSLIFVGLDFGVARLIARTIARPVIFKEAV